MTEPSDRSVEQARGWLIKGSVHFEDEVLSLAALLDSVREERPTWAKLAELGYLAHAKQDALDERNAEVARVVREVKDEYRCTCSVEYTGRDLVDPHCVKHSDTDDLCDEIQRRLGVTDD